MNATKKTAPKKPTQDVLIGYLCQDEVTYSFHRSLTDLTFYDAATNKRVKSWQQVRTGPLGLSESRNKLADCVIKDKTIDWLLMIDSDMGFEPDSLDRLLAVADPKTRPVIGGLCFAMRTGGSDGMGGMLTYPSPTIMQWTNAQQEDGEYRFVGVSHYPANMVIPAGATGAAFLLIHRSALETVLLAEGPRWFDRVQDADPNKLMGEDVSFCWRLKQHNIPLAIHTGVRTTHMKTVWLCELDFWNSRVAKPATDRAAVLVYWDGSKSAQRNMDLLLQSLKSSTGLAEAYYIIDEGDATAAHEVQTRGGRVIPIDTARYAKGKASAINAAYEALETLDTAPWVLVVNATARFRPAWLDKALEVAYQYDAPVIGTNDLFDNRITRAEHSNFVLMRREYINESGATFDNQPMKVLHEQYTSEYMMEELVNAARLRGLFQMALGSHIEDTIRERPAPDAATIKRDGVLFQGRVAAALRGGESRNKPLVVIGLGKNDIHTQRADVLPSK